MGRVTRALVALLLMLLALSSVASSVARGSFSLCQALGGPSHCREVRLLTAGVASDGASLRGFPMDLYVAVASGNGLVLTRAELSTDEYFTAFSYVAVLAAATAVGVDFSRYSYYVYLDAPIAKVAGPSSSAAVGLGAALALLNLTLSEPVAVVGILLPDGGFGYVGYADEKLLSLVDRVRLVLVPYSQSLSWDTLKLYKDREVRIVEVADLYEALQVLGGLAVGSVGGSRGYLRQLLEEWVRLVNESLGRSLEKFKDLCRDLEYSEGSALVRPHGVVVLLHLLSVVKSAWTCGVESGALRLSDVVADVRGRLTRLYEEYQEWSRSLPTAVGTLVVLSEVYAALVKAEELFDRAVGYSETVVEAIEELAASYTLAEAALAALKALRGAVDLLRLEGEVSLDRLSVLYRYASYLYALLRSSSIPVDRVEELDSAGRLLLKAENLSAKDPAAALALYVSSLSRLAKLLYLDQYQGSQRALEALRRRALRLSNLSAAPIPELYVELGDAYASLGAGFEEVLEVYLDASIRGFAYAALFSSLTEVVHVPPTLTFTWYLLLAVSPALGVSLALLLRRARGSSARRTLRSYLQSLPLPRS